tara:strand:+ start:168 stop:359 length:192 start_codon:yes stop_codon:yes gene_type:complete
MNITPLTAVRAVRKLSMTSVQTNALNAKGGTMKVSNDQFDKDVRNAHILVGCIGLLFFACFFL